MGMINRLIEEGKLSGWLAANGRIWTASEAAFNTAVTGSTTLANTAPTIMIDVPSGTTCVPLALVLAQVGTVAGGDITVIVEYDNADRYTSGGTEATYLNTMIGARATPNCDVYSRTGSAIVATNAYGVRDQYLLLGPDVSPAEGAVQEPIWSPLAAPLLLAGPAAFLVYTNAGTTGPTWGWSLKFGEFPTTQMEIPTG